MQLEIQVLGMFLVLCRIGACLMVLPGLATAGVPASVRLYLAVALALLAAPVIDLEPSRNIQSGPALLPIIAAECMIGGAIGLTLRLLVEALEFSASAISSYIGLNGLISLNGDEPQPALSALITAAGTLLILILGLPQQMVVGVVDSYEVLPLGMMPGAAPLLVRFTDVLSAAFLMGLRLTAPFIIYGLLVNAMFALAGRMVPQIQSYFLSTPFLALGGLALMYLVGAELLRAFGDAVLVQLQRL